MINVKVVPISLTKQKTVDLVQTKEADNKSTLEHTPTAA